MTSELIGIGLAVFFGIVTTIALVYTIYYGRKAQYKKILVYINSFSIPLARAFSPEDDYSLTVLFQRKGAPAEQISSVYTTFLKFANLGREPIRRIDIAPANPIRVNVEEARTLDIQIEAVTRAVNNISLVHSSLNTTSSSAQLIFDFLDYKDGALIKIMTVGNKGKISLIGDIIGMPDGIINIPKFEEGRDISGWWFILLLLFTFALTGGIYYLVQGSWTNFWLTLIIIPILAIIILVSLTISDLFRPNRKFAFPESLELPKWCYRFGLNPRYLFREKEMRSIAKGELDNNEPNKKSTSV